MQVYPTKPPVIRAMSLAPKWRYETMGVFGYDLPVTRDGHPAWDRILQVNDFPRTVVTLDFETFVDETYRMSKGGNALSTIEFIQDKRFEITALAHLIIPEGLPFTDYMIATDCTVGEEAVGQYIKWLQFMYGDNFERCTIVMQNARFDATILSRRFGIHPKYLIDTLSLARHWNSRTKNDVKNLAERFGLPAKGDTASFDGLTLRQRLIKPKKGKKSRAPVRRPIATEEQLAKLAEYAIGDVQIQWVVFTLLLPKLSNPAIELRLMQQTLEMFTKPSLMVDTRKGEELIATMNGEIDAAIALTGHERKEISGDKSFTALLEGALLAAGDTLSPYMKPGARGPILAIAKPDEQRVTLQKHPDPAVRTLMAARLALDSWPLHIGRITRILAQSRADGGFLPVPLKYHGAHTGRDAGGEKINLQNLPSRGDRPSVLAIRNLLIAALGRTLVVADSSAIEARVLAWVAGQNDLVEKFKSGEEIYCGFAAKVLGYPVRKPKKVGGIPAVERRMAWARNSIGKVGILGCGYGMGPAKAESYANGAIDLQTAERIVTTYRAENTKITAFWKDIEKAFVYTAKYKRSVALRSLRFDSADDCRVIITLPNGRELKYHEIKFSEGRFGNEAITVYNALEHKFEHTWGGSLTENVVQAMSRDILMEAMFRAEDKGIRTALRVHDELVAVVDEAEGPEALKTLIAELSVEPVWAPGCPLAAEGLVTRVYGTH